MIIIKKTLNGVFHRGKSNNKEYYVAFVNGKQYSYRVNRYGVCAKKLAELSFINNRKFYDYFTIEHKTIVFHVMTKKYGIKNVYVDPEDFDILCNLKISISLDRHTFYAKTKLGPVHRLIMKPKSSNDFVDHINHNGLDNRKYNLRIVDCSTNNRNSKIRKDNKLNFRGVYLNNKGSNVSYTTTWRDNNHKMHSKSFSINKYGDALALNLAKEYRLKKEKEFNYLSIESSTTIPKGSTD